MAMLFAAVGLLMLGCAYSQPLAREDVFKANVSGSQVVETVVDIISRTCLLDNEIFLRRMANVETNDGTDPNTYRDSYHGGIWKIDEAMFAATKNKSSLNFAYDTIKRTLHIDWSNVTWADMRRPVYSALGASLLLTAKHFQNIPENLEVQATIWNALHPGRSRPFTFVGKEYNNAIECNADKKLDVVVALHFKYLTPFDLVDTRDFLENLFQRFSLGLNNTRVGIVTERQLHPTPAWYLNSQAAGSSVLNTLKALNYQTGGPTAAGDALLLTRETMFDVTNGARPDASKVAILITDDLTQPDFTHNEASKLRDTGVTLMVLHISNRTESKIIEGLVDSPKCQNARSLRTFDELDGVVERLTRGICSVPMTLPVGTYTFACGHNLTARLPDTSLGLSVMVTPSTGNVTLFAAKMYQQPDDQSHDAHWLSRAGNATVLYARGTDPLYMHVKGQGPSCTGSYTVEMKETTTFPQREGVCFVAGTVRRCNDLEMDLITHDLVLVPEPDAPFLCDTRNRSLEYFPHPTDDHKFIMCDRNDNTFVGICPVGGAKCEAFTSGCKYTSPCTPEALLNGDKYFMEPCGDQETYVTCTSLGIAEVSECPPSYIWNQDTLHCVFKYVHDAISNMFYTSIDNPCVHAHSEHVYFPFPQNASAYIFCDTFGNAIANRCRAGNWNEQLRACTDKSASLIG